MTIENERSRLEQLDAFNEQLMQERRANERRLAAKAARLRAAALVDAATLAVLDEHRKIYPPAAVYACDFWRRVVLNKVEIINGQVEIDWS